MEIKAFKEKVFSCGERWSSRLELPMEAELLIPDYQPPVFKIIKTIVLPVVLQKHTAERKLALEGYLRCCIFYQSEDGCKLCQIEQKLPFSKTLELPEGKFRDELIETCGEVEYMNCRATHSRRLELRGCYGLQLTAVPQLEKEVITQLAEGNLEQKTVTVNGLELLPCGDRVITCQEEVELNQIPGDVLYISGAAQIDEIQQIEDKAVIKGKILGEILYGMPEEKALRAKAFSVPLRQVADVPGLGENSVCQAAVEPISWTLEGRDNETADLTVTSMLRFRAWEPQEKMMVADAFSVTHQTQVTYANLCPERLFRRLDESIHCNTVVSIEETSQLLFRLVQAEPPELREGTLTGKGIVFLFLYNGTGEMECREQPYEYHWEQALPEKAELFASVLPGEISLHQSGNQVSLEFDLNLSGLLLETTPMPVLQSIEQGQPVEQQPDAPSLHIYYAQPGQSVFNIAKALGASPKTMLTCNGLTQDILEQNQHLLVPRAN